MEVGCNNRSITDMAVKAARKNLYTSSPERRMRGLVVFLLTALMVLSACGGRSGHFRITGRFRSFNQGEFYIYRPYDGPAKLDTIKVADGRFAYEVALDEPATFAIIFPNYSEQVVFGEPGAAVTINGDASHLREMEIKGTAANKLMTGFRLNANKMSPPEVKESVVKFVNDNPTSPVSIYLIDKYLVLTASPDYEQAYRLTEMMYRKDADNTQLAKMTSRLKTLKEAAVGAQLPDFSATDTGGGRVTKAMLKGKVVVISAWASWNYDSQKQQRKLQQLRKTYGDDLAVISICIDRRAADCERIVKRDSISWPNVCDGNMWATPLLLKMGMADVPDNIIADRNGRVVARLLDCQQMEEKLKSMLK